MSMTVVPALQTSLTANGTTAGVVTIASTANIVPGTYGYLSGSGKTTITVKVMSVPSSTTLRVQQVNDRSTLVGGVEKSLTPSQIAPNYGVTDVSTYTTAATSTLSIPNQAVFGDGSGIPAIYG